MKLKIKKALNSIPKAIKHVFIRKHFIEYDFAAGTTSWRDCAAIIRSIANGDPLQDGTYLKTYEELVAKYHGVRYSYSFATGRMALYAILEALEIGAGDEIILPAYTCVVCPNAIIYKGAKPVYADIDAQTFNIDPGKIEAKITPRTKAIIVQHTFGLPCDLDEIMKIAKKYDIYVIEDCAHALGAEYKGRKVGSIGVAGFFSTDHTKMISTSTGGMAITDNEAIAVKLQKIQTDSPFLSRITTGKILFTFLAENFLRNPRVDYAGKWVMMLFCNIGLCHFFLDEGMTKKPTKYPYPARLSNIQAMTGIRQMKCLEENIAHRRNIAKKYDEVFGLYKGQFDGSKTDRKHVFLRYSFLIKDPGAYEKKVSKYLALGNWFNSIAIGRTKDFQEIYYTEGECPIGESAAKHSANFPTHCKVKNPSLIVGFAKDIVKSNALISP